MKNTLKTFFLFFALTAATAVLDNDKAVAQSVSFQAFYDDLSPHGRWLQSADYGYVWQPNNRSGFIPYASNGYWVFTNAGWTWVSDYSWGWAPFHYGRWYNDPFYGYLWVPGYEWGPGWVTWRQSDDYFGWAPIGPGVNMQFAYGNNYFLPYNQWNFVRRGDFGRRNIYRYYINRSRNEKVMNNASPINNIHDDRVRNTQYNLGPDRMVVQQNTGRKITTMPINDEQKPGQQVTGNSIRLYRPKIETNTSQDKPVPVKVLPMNAGPAKPADVKNEREVPTVKSVQVQKPVLPEPTKDPSVKPVTKTLRDDQDRPAPDMVKPALTSPVKKVEETRTVPSVKQETAPPVREERVTPVPHKPVISRPTVPAPVREPVREQQVRPVAPSQQAPVRQRPVQAERSFGDERRPERPRESEQSIRQQSPPASFERRAEPVRQQRVQQPQPQQQRLNPPVRRAPVNKQLPMNP